MSKKTEQPLTEDAVKHQLKIAASTLKMSDAGASIMGGMSKSEAAKLIARHKGRDHAVKSLKLSGHTDQEIAKLLEGKKTETDIITEAIEALISEVERGESEHEPFPSSDFKKVKLGTLGKHTLSHVTRLKDNHSFYHLSDDWRSDYPLHHPHNDTVAFDKPGQFPKKVVSWASSLVKKHAKGTLKEAWYGSGSPLSHPSFETGKSVGSRDPVAASGLRDKLYAIHKHHNDIASEIGKEMDKLHYSKKGTPEEKRYRELSDKRDKHASLSNRAYAAFRGISSAQIAKR
jgi:hypothetical protein